MFSEAQEIAMGNESHPAILAQFGEVQDEELQKYFNDIGQKMAALSHRPHLKWQFTVVDDSLVNAFAVPGGFIYFTRGILAYMNNEAELAGVLGHEIGHVTARHSVAQLSKSQLFGLGVGIGSIFSPTFAQYSDLAQMGLGILFLKYGRDDETESDELGVKYMYEMGYDPTQLSGFFEVFERMSEESGRSVPSWLSSHPAPPDRIQKTSSLARTMLAGNPRTNLKISRQPFLNRIKGLVYGENPREGFVENGRFLHPDLRFQMRFPDDWKVQNTRSAVYILAPSQQAGIQLTLAPPEVKNPRTRAENIAQQPGIEMLETSSRQINGLNAFSAVYQVNNQNGTIQALASFISYRDNLYEIMGLSQPAQFNQYADAFKQTIRSFQTLKDEKILAVQPDKLELYQVKRGGTLKDVARLYPNQRVDVSSLSLLNRIGETERLKAGQTVKVIRAGR
jgi:predicted Zn-dependent protease